MMVPSPRPPRPGKRASRGPLGCKGGALSITSWPRQAQLSLRECEGGPDVFELLRSRGRPDETKDGDIQMGRRAQVVSTTDRLPGVSRDLVAGSANTFLAYMHVGPSR